MAADEAARGADEDARTIEVTRRDLLALLTRQEMSARVMNFVFRVPEREAGSTLHVRDLLECRLEHELDAKKEFLDGLAFLGITPAQALESRVLSKETFRNYVEQLQEALLSAAERGGPGAAESVQIPEYKGELRVLLDATVLGERVSAAMGAADAPFAVRLRATVAPRAPTAATADAAVAVSAGGKSVALPLPRDHFFETPGLGGGVYVWVSAPGEFNFKGWLVRSVGDGHGAFRCTAEPPALRVARLLPPAAPEARVAPPSSAAAAAQRPASPLSDATSKRVRQLVETVNSKLARGEHEEALSAGNEAVRIDPRSALGFRARAEAHRMLNHLREAIDDATVALRLEAGHPRALFTRAEANRMLGRHEAAIRDATEALRANPLLTDAFFTRGEAHRLQGSYKEAIDDATEALRLDPRHALALAARGASKRLLGDLAGAREDLEASLRLKPGYTFVEEQLVLLSGDTRRPHRQQ